MSTKEFKMMVKEKIRKAAFKELKEKKATHEKVSELSHSHLNHPQNFLTEKDQTTKKNLSYTI